MAEASSTMGERISIQSSIISGNDAAYGGGGSICWRLHATINQSAIYGNTASSTGGGIYRAIKAI